jgi:hypothetical protein
VCEQKYAWLKDEEARLILELNRRGESPPRVELPREKAPEVHPSAEVLSSSESAGVEFTHSKDYTNVRMRDGQNFTLTPQQAHMIQILHEARENGACDVRNDYILEEFGREHRGESSKWQDTWKSNPEARKALIKSGQRRGTLRLNI